jgi:hypothetical protein
MKKHLNAGFSRFSFGASFAVASLNRLRTLLTLMLLAAGGSAMSQETSEPQAYLDFLGDLFFLEAIDEPVREEVRYHLVPLGAVQKVRGKWAPRGSERVSGERQAHTWRVTEGFAVAEVIEELELKLKEDPTAELLFSCGGVSCGSSVQWANSIFGERLLYGTQASQRYRVYRLGGEGMEYRMLVYGAARTVDRQYLRVELLSVANTR